MPSNIVKHVASRNEVRCANADTERENQTTQTGIWFLCLPSLVSVFSRLPSIMMNPYKQLDFLSLEALSSRRMCFPAKDCSCISCTCCKEVATLAYEAESDVTVLAYVNDEPAWQVISLLF